MKHATKYIVILLLLVIVNVTSCFAATKYRVSFPEDYNVLLVGDSRTVGVMMSIDTENVAYICEVDKGYEWLNNKAQYDIIQKTKPGTKVIFNLGVNDVDNKEWYKSMYNYLAKTLQDKCCQVYFETVNPVSEKCDNPSNSDIDEFNSYMFKYLEGVSFINTNDYLKNNGYETVDGLHYTEETTQKTFDYISKVLALK